MRDAMREADRQALDAMAGKQPFFTCGDCGEQWNYLEFGEECDRNEDLYNECMSQGLCPSCLNEYPSFDDFEMPDYSFRDPGGNSALRNGARIHPCPTCGRPNMLSEADKRLGYQCDYCADELERGY